MTDAILCANQFDGGGGAFDRITDWEAAASDKSNDHWFHFDADHADAQRAISHNAFGLDPLVIEALLAEETRPRITQFDSGFLLTLRGVNLNENARPEDMVSIRLWVDEHRVISTRKRRLKAVNDIRHLLELGQGPKNTMDFVCQLIARMFERMEPTLTDLDESVDAIEEGILENANTNQRETITAVRKQTIIFRRYMAPQREALNQLKSLQSGWINDQHRRFLNESYNNIVRYIEDLDATRERAQIVKDELANILADRLNKNTYLLSVIAAIFLPLGFLTGLLGINVGGIPGAENTNAFWVFIVILLVIVVLQAVIFKKLKWF
jgi:zinc transporter